MDRLHARMFTSKDVDKINDILVGRLKSADIQGILFMSAPNNKGKSSCANCCLSGISNPWRTCLDLKKEENRLRGYSCLDNHLVMVDDLLAE